MSYVKQTWQPGEPVTASKLNHIEDGILAAGQTAANAMIKGVDYVTAGQTSDYTIGTGATAEGSNVNASGDYSHAEGFETTTYGDYSHAEGNSIAYDDYSHAEGKAFAHGNYSHAEGWSVSMGDYSHAEGTNSTALGQGSHAEGDWTLANYYSHTEGEDTAAVGDYSHAEGRGYISAIYLSGVANSTTYTYTPEDYDLPADYNGYIRHNNEIAQIVSVDRSNHTITLEQTINADQDFVDEYTDIINYGALGSFSHSEGDTTVAAGHAAHAEGSHSKAVGNYSHAQGFYTAALSSYQSVSGKYNVADFGDDYAEIVGNGQSEDSRSNARTLDWDGNETLAGKLTIGVGPANNMDVTTKQYVDTAIEASKGMVILSYGHSTWDDFISAYQSHNVVYCRASSNSNPATGSQTRLAFMVYVSNAENPTNVEFQYYRSVSSHSATQQGDQVYVYKLDKTAGWTVTVRESYTKMDFNDGLTSSYSSGTITAKIADSNVTAAKLATDAVITEKIKDEAVTPEKLSEDLQRRTGDTQYTADSEAYSYRKTPSAAGGAVNIESIVGASVGWNQLVPTRTASGTENNITIASNNDGKWTITVNNATGYYQIILDSNIELISGHKYYVAGQMRNKGIEVYLAGASSQTAGAYLINAEASGVRILFLYVGASTPNGTYNIYPQIIDLTAMLGPTIADHIYSLEQANAGAGVAYFERYFGTGYHAYDAGSIVSVNTSGRRATGKNLCPMGAPNQTANGLTFTVTNGTIIVNGTATGNGNINIAKKSWQPFLAKGLSAQYTLSGCPSGGGTSTYYLALTDNIVATYFDDGSGTTFTLNEEILDNDYAVRFYYKTGATFNNAVLKPMLRFAETDSDFEPYHGITYPTTASDLRGIFKLTEGKLTADGDVYLPSGAVTRKYGIVDLGSLTWTYNTSYSAPFLIATISGYKDNTLNMICAKGYKPLSSLTEVLNQDKSMVITSGTLRIHDSAYTDAATFKTAMNGVYLVGELATPTTETLAPYSAVQNAIKGGTEEWVGTDIPVGGDFEYASNEQDKLSALPGAAGADGIYFVSQENGQMKLLLAGSGAGFHNSLFRGMYLGDRITDEQNEAIKNRTYDGLFVGDYWTINGHTWRIAAFEYYWNCGDANFAKGHLIVVPDGQLYAAPMNATNITDGGYTGSAMFTGESITVGGTTYTGLANARTIAATDFGSHVAAHRIMCTNATASGKPSGCAWRDSDGIELMNEQQVYGAPAWRDAAQNGFDVGTQKMQFPLFLFAPQYVNTRQNYWLQDVRSAVYFAFVNLTGYADYGGASSALGVRPAVTLSYI